MARKLIKPEQQSIQTMPITYVAAEQDSIEQPISSGDTIAVDSDVTMTEGQVDEGDQMIYENRKTGKS